MVGHATHLANAISPVGVDTPECRWMDRTDKKLSD